jgi:hypothetical protein
MAVTKDADILKAVVERLRQRITAGVAKTVVCLQKKSNGTRPQCTIGRRQKGRNSEPHGVCQVITRNAGWARVALEHRTRYKQWVRRWWHASDRNGQAPNRAEWQQMSAQWWATQRERESAGARLQQKARAVEKSHRVARGQRST